MWEGLVRAPRGRVSTRKLIVLATSLLVAIFVNLIVSSSTAFAADVTWVDDNTISYNSRDYTGPTTATANDDSGLQQGTIYFSANEGNKGYLIYFKNGENPKNATEAFFISSDYDPVSGRFSNLSPPQNVTIEPASSLPPGGTSPGTSGECDVKGIGWIICPVSNWLAEQVDNIFDALKDFFIVHPLTDGNNSLYRVWDVMRDIANVLFIIGFLVIIYSYITGGLLDNYSLKKILPRVILAAIMINISYWICAVLVDITNIAGVAFNDLFMSIRDSAIGTEENTTIRWSELTAYILSGGAVAAGGIAFLVVAGGSIASLTFLIFAALIGAAFAVLVALIILAARQALITVMIVIAPIAIAAYILPNTEDWFSKWRKGFITILMVFPVFGILFGGSQLASSIIMQNAPTLAVLILGLVVQVVPLVITPFLIQFSGGLLGRIAGMTNNSGRGLVDRSKNWARDRSDYHRQRSLGDNAARWQLMRRGAQGFDRSRRARDDRRQNYDTAAKNRYQKGRSYADIDQHRRELEHEGANVDAGHSRRWQRQFDMQDKSFNQRLFDREVNTRSISDKSKLAEERMNTAYQEMRSGANPYHALGKQGPTTWSMQAQIDDVSSTARDISIEGLKKSSAETLESQNLTQALLHQEQLRTYAGGARGLEGADSALAKAVAAYRGDFGKGISEKAELMRHFNLSSEQRQQIAMGSDSSADVVATRDDGSTYTFRVKDEYTKEAMISEQLKTGSFGQIQDIINSSSGINKEYALTISQDIVSNGLPNKAFYWGAKTIDDVAQGKYGSPEAVADAVTYHVREGKLSAEKLARQSPGAIEQLIQTANDANAMARMNAQQRALFDQRYQNIRYEAWILRDDAQLASMADEATKTILKTIEMEPPESYKRRS